MAGDIERADQRAADTDRAAVAERLRHAVDEGRLDLSDYDERLREAYAARTYGELERLTADLPAPVPDPTPARVGKERSAARQEWATEWRGLAGTSIVLVAIWGITSVASGSAIFFWPMFPIGIWAAILLASAVTGSKHD